MTAFGFARLLLLSAIWGGSFLFIRITAVDISPAWLILMRVGLAAGFLAAAAVLLRKPLPVAGQGRHYLFLGLFGAALPFLLFAFAAQTLTASMLSILNATAPMWAALLAAVWARVYTTPMKWLGMGVGLCGVAWLAGVDAIDWAAGYGWAMLAGLLAPISYGVATHYLSRTPGQSAFANAHGSMWAAALLLLPLAAVSPMPGALPWMPTGLSVVALGVLCSGVAYLIYFGLITEFGATSALTVTLLTPMFGTLWGVWILNEPVGWRTVVGGALVLLGTTLTVGRPAGTGRRLRP